MKAEDQEEKGRCAVKTDQDDVGMAVVNQVHTPGIDGGTGPLPHNHPYTHVSVIVS